MLAPGVLRKIIFHHNHDNCISLHLTARETGGGEEKRRGRPGGEGDLVMGSFKATSILRVSLVFSSYIK